MVVISCHFTQSGIAFVANYVKLTETRPIVFASKI